ncbi:kinase-like domain-containing protein [Rhizophagus irregularis DAOM 181602=DAOM 197198]|uniref:Kinase-like domain-containing protein n=1 Tax=Rhizophagus irregularis (strain DAOM 181602 / DAOM 197198 / MUCL 43194) TaxID=747089 RepID=A0A2P4NY09_RHIID|nr:kinase-like domain-containing protein [Rhizophagus irregularis DAOM 181602=DAOM 197198]POG58025.1 kinase-like domain-containing protein [Rhizophagus irregularis DAOM 181602=DAOM 197198]|eukprot:XP_025164891.1 kinase-like domain-containing protein [Rhizophagus irregularis DAOM 181602=DAOM 197198]
MNYTKLNTKYKFKALVSKDLRDEIEEKGVCSNCKSPNTGEDWCNKCDPGRFLREGKSSGDPELDKLIYESQLQTNNYYHNLEWIPYDRFQDIKPIGKGGYAIVYSATWLDGEPNELHRERTGPITVALKKFKSSLNIMEALTNEVKIHNECNTGSTRLYGITRGPRSKEPIMVLAYAKHGNLRNYLKEKFSTLKWEHKLNILSFVTLNLQVIHGSGCIHKDLHSGNILIGFNDPTFNFGESLNSKLSSLGLNLNDDEFPDTKITDFGLSQFINNSKTSDSTNVCGILPYVAPEILEGEPYTEASDIYSLGIIMTELTTGKPPYGTVPHNDDLTLAICSGLRPRVAKGTPKRYIDLVNQCLDAEPQERPSSIELYRIFENWKLKLEDKKPSKIFDEFSEADKIILESPAEITLHDGAIYISRNMRFPNNLPKSVNSQRVQFEDNNVSDSDLINRMLVIAIQEQSQGIFLFECYYV